MKPEPLPPFAQAILDIEKERPSVPVPAPSLSTRVLERLHSAGLPSVPTIESLDGPTTPTPTNAVATIAKLKLGIALAFVGGAGMGSGITWLGVRGNSEAQKPSTLESPEPARSVVIAEQKVPEAALAPVVPTKSPVPRPKRAPIRLEQEQALLDIARTALLSGRGEAAVDALERHAREYPKGSLREEREVLHIQADVLRGRRDEAEIRARAFRIQYPSSILLPAVDAALRE